MLPIDMWSVQAVNQYLRPDGEPHRGYVLLIPEARSVTSSRAMVTTVLEPARLDIDDDGYVAAELLHPGDPDLRATGVDGVWGYRVQETFQAGGVVEWRLLFPDAVGDGDFLDLSEVPRLDECVVRPASWFPRHLIDTPVQASRISPRNGPLLRRISDSSGS
ncbi:hypothetical protein [Rhodococcus qingshengii]|uniref:hypothetical protein n=1 Tax=Rhodococcus qingshengii TaxID=334542 RepID=UPI0035DC9904